MKIPNDQLQVQCKRSKTDLVQKTKLNYSSLGSSMECCETPSIQYKLKNLTFSLFWKNYELFSWPVKQHYFLQGDEVSFGWTNFFWCGGGRGSQFLSRMWQLYFLFLCNILYTAVPSSLSLKQAQDQYNVLTDFLLSSWERCRTTVEEMSFGADAI